MWSLKPGYRIIASFAPARYRIIAYFARQADETTFSSSLHIKYDQNSKILILKVGPRHLQFLWNCSSKERLKNFFWQFETVVEISFLIGEVIFQPGLELVSLSHFGKAIKPPSWFSFLNSVFVRKVFSWNLILLHFCWRAGRSDGRQFCFSLPPSTSWIQVGNIQMQKEKNTKCKQTNTKKK